jgi:hypothetical protein
MTTLGLHKMIEMNDYKLALESKQKAFEIRLKQERAG